MQVCLCPHATSGVLGESSARQRQYHAIATNKVTWTPPIGGHWQLSIDSLGEDGRLE